MITWPDDTFMIQKPKNNEGALNSDLSMYDDVSEQEHFSFFYNHVSRCAEAS